MALVEGMFAEFDVIPNVSKTDGKTYLNIVGATPVTQLREDVPAESPPSNRLESPKQYHQDAPDSMILSYAKDGAIRLSKDVDTPDEFVRKVFIIYGGLKAILAETYNLSENAPF
jgi:hypothetical protein